MAMNTVVVTLSEADLLELQAILIDRDESAALTFLADRVAPRIPSKGSAPCDSTRRNPYLFRPERRNGGS